MKKDITLILYSNTISLAKKVKSNPKTVESIRHTGYRNGQTTQAVYHDSIHKD